MKVMVLIPSRMASTRLPNKPLADIGGLPMVVRVLRQAEQAGAGDVWVAAGDAEIVNAVNIHGGRAVLTDADLPSGSDRIWQACQRLMEEGVPKPDIIINAQGDEPLLPPELITQCVEAFQAMPGVDVVTFGHVMDDPNEIADPSKVKIAMAGDADGKGGRALYFSRSVIPYGAGSQGAMAAIRHIGFYGYRYDALARFVAAAPTELEKTEKLEQLRGMEMGLAYHVILTHHEPVGVDTQENLDSVRAMMAASGML
jgi:3-deoxy-manno-octulosonate cytidylyltransferase (CMP-KDO synthetase)